MSYISPELHFFFHNGHLNYNNTCMKKVVSIRRMHFLIKETQSSKIQSILISKSILLFSNFPPLETMDYTLCMCLDGEHIKHTEHFFFFLLKLRQLLWRVFDWLVYMCVLCSTTLPFLLVYLGWWQKNLISSNKIIILDFISNRIENFLKYCNWTYVYRFRDKFNS